MIHQVAREFRQSQIKKRAHAVWKICLVFQSNVGPFWFHFEIQVGSISARASAEIRLMRPQAPGGYGVALSPIPFLMSLLSTFLFLPSSLSLLLSLLSTPLNLSFSLSPLFPFYPPLSSMSRNPKPAWLVAGWLLAGWLVASVSID